MVYFKSILVLPFLIFCVLLQSCTNATKTPSDTAESKETAESHQTTEVSDSTEDTYTTETDTTDAEAGVSPLKVEKGKILDSNNEIVQLKGMSLFWSQWMPQYYNFETVKNLKEHWNINVIRAAMAVEHDGYIENPEREKQKVMAVIDAAIELDIYVIVDWHDHQGENHVEEAKAFFSDIAEKYHQFPNIIYETYNEPLDVSWSETLKPYHEEVIAAIRKHDDNNVIVLGTPNWSQRVDLAAEDPVDAKNIAYTLHFYSGTHKEDLRQKAEIAIEKGLALFVTEFGTTNANGDGEVFKKETTKWWDFLDKHNISWCNWSIADKNEASAALKPGTLSEDLEQPENLTKSGKFVRDRLLNLNL